MEKQIKIIGIVSSPRLNGNTAVLAREALKGAEAAGAKTMEIFLKNHRIEFCRGCSACMAQGGCVISDEFAALKKELAAADGIILASPNYANSFNAIMKQFLERLGLFEFLTSSLLGGRYVAGISTAGGAGAGKVARELTGLAGKGIFKRGYISGALGVNLNTRQISECPAELQKARSLGVKMVMDIQYGRTYPLQNLFSRMITALFVKPNFKRFINNGKQNRLKAVYENLSARALI